MSNRRTSTYLSNISSPTTPRATNGAYSYLLPVAFGLIAAIALFGNGLLCVVILKNYRMLRSAYNLLIFSLAVTDMLTGRTFLEFTGSLPCNWRRNYRTHVDLQITDCNTWWRVWKKVSSLKIRTAHNIFVRSIRLSYANTKLDVFCRISS